MTEPEATAGLPLDVAAIHAAHADFVWATLHRMGVREADLADMLQEVFVVVHRRGSTYDGECRMTSWLFGICVRVAAGYRRRAYVRRERPTANLPELAGSAEGSPEHAASMNQARARLAAVLDTLTPDRRAVFVMFELEGMGTEAIAAMLDVPVGTIYSRLHQARKDFEGSLARLDAQDAGRLARGRLQRAAKEAR